MRITVLLMVILLAACHDNCEMPEDCPTAETLDSIPWLAELKASMTNCSCELSIIQGIYKKQTVFYAALTDPFCNGVNTPVLYNCSGTEVRSFTTSETDQQELDQITDRTVLYRCKD